MPTPERQRADDDAATRCWPAVLRDANADIDERMAARGQLASTYERMGRYDEAASLLVANVQDGAMSVEILEQLNRLYRARGGGR